MAVFLAPIAITAAASLGHYGEVGLAEPAFWQELATSLASAAGATALTVATALPAAYALARSRFPGDRVLTQGLLVLASLPAMAYVLPLGELVRRAGLIDTFPALVFAEAAVTAPLAVYVLHGALSQLPVDGEEEAWMDGAGVWRVLAGIVLPQAAPSVAATAIVLFVLDWNLLLVPLALTAGELKTLPVAMTDFFTFERDLEWPVAAAALVISLAPVVVVVAAFHRVLDRFTLAR